MRLVTHEEASRNILAFANEGRLVQTKWHVRAADGREIACLLGAIHSSIESTADCDAELMPPWMPELTVTLFDGIAAEETVPIARRYGELVARWNKIDRAGWHRILNRFLVYLIDQAVDAARPVAEGKQYWPQVADACEQTKLAIVAGDPDELTAAGASAWAFSAWASSAWAASARAAWAAAARAAAYLRLFTSLLDQIEGEIAAL